MNTQQLKSKMLLLSVELHEKIAKQYKFDMSLAILRAYHYYTLKEGKKSSSDSLGLEQLSDAMIMFYNLFDSITEKDIIKDLCTLLSYKMNNAKNHYDWNALDFYYQLLIKKA